MTTHAKRPHAQARVRIAAAAAMMLSLVVGGGLATAGPVHAVTSADAPADTSAAVSIDLGGAGGGDFLADAYGTGGSADSLPSGVASFPNWGPTVPHPIPEAVWDTSRVGESHYAIPGLTPGTVYQARLYFMDWYYSHSGQREFDVAIDGNAVLTDFDIIGTAVAAGADGQEAFGVEKDFPVTVGDSGTVDIDFTRGAANQPQVNAIVLTPGG